VLGIELVAKILMTDWMSNLRIFGQQHSDCVTDVALGSKARLSLSYQEEVSDGTASGGDSLPLSAGVEEIRLGLFSTLIRRCRDTAPTGKSKYTYCMFAIEFIFISTFHFHFLL